MYTDFLAILAVEEKILILPRHFSSKYIIKQYGNQGKQCQ
jgi:hypothetical protein